MNQEVDVEHIAHDDEALRQKAEEMVSPDRSPEDLR